jgi:hypothetical protein
MSLMPRQVIVESVKRFLSGRRGAYARRLDIQDPDARAILVDLARFCRAHKSTAHPDPYIASKLDGRREVWLRIQQHLKLDDETLWLLYAGPNMKGE